MYQNRKITIILTILIIITGVLLFRLIFLKNKFNAYENQVVFNVAEVNNVKTIEKYGYTDILDCLRKDKGLEVKSINMIDNGRCNVEVNYKGDLKSLYSSLYTLSESKNFIVINSISINKDSNITNISIDFKKNK